MLGTMRVGNSRVQSTEISQFMHPFILSIYLLTSPKEIAKSPKDVVTSLKMAEFYLGGTF